MMTRNALLQHAALAGAAALLAGCTALTVDNGEGMRGKRTYVGVVHIEEPADPNDPPQSSRVQVLDVRTLGVRFGGGVSVGYLNDRLISVPLDCRVVIFIRSISELDQAEALLRNLLKEEACIARTS
jgi:hypothetical protein